MLFAGAFQAINLCGTTSGLGVARGRGGLFSPTYVLHVRIFEAHLPKPVYGTHFGENAKMRHPVILRSVL